MVGGRFGMIWGRFGMIWGWFGVVWGWFGCVVWSWFWVVRSRFGCVIDRFLRFVCRSRVMVRFFLRIVRSSLIGDLGHISVVMISSVLHMLSSPVGKSNGVGTCIVCTQLGRFISCHDFETKRRFCI